MKGYHQGIKYASRTGLVPNQILSLNIVPETINPALIEQKSCLAKHHPLVPLRLEQIILSIHDNILEALVSPESNARIVAIKVESRTIRPRTRNFSPCIVWNVHPHMPVENFVGSNFLLTTHLETVQLS